MNQENCNQQLTPHFSLKEMTESQMAVKHGIANVPSELEIENLRKLCKGTLEPLREALGLPIIITSGYRCKALNERVIYRSLRSQHVVGQAADFYVAPSQSGLSRRELLIKAFRLIIQDERIDYDQLILYPSFIHVSFVSRERNRRTILLGMRNGKLGYGKCSIQNALKIQ